MSRFPFSLEGIRRAEELYSKQLAAEKEQGNKKQVETGIETVLSYPLYDYQNEQEAASKDESKDPSDTILLNAMISEISCADLAPQKMWSALQHYIYFIYRHVVSVKPYNNSDTIPHVICKAIGAIFDNLLEVDTTQVCIKLISLLRDYVLVAKIHLDNIKSPNVATYLVTLMAYYSALCSSSGKCAPLLPEFDFLTLGRFNINWIGINKSIFYHHIYLSSNVQDKIPLFIKLHEENSPTLKGLLETFVCFTQDMQALATKWANLKMQITNASKARARANPKKHLLKDWKMYSEHKKIFNSSGWLNRNSKIIKIQDMNELDAHILAWVADKSAIPESLIDDRGCCLCEDCLTAEFRNNSMAAALAQSFRAEMSASCLVSCYICQEPIVLNNLLQHIVKQHNNATENDEHVYPLTFQRQQKQLTMETPKICDSLYEGLLEKNAQIKRSLLQLIDGTSSQRNKVLREKNKKESSFTTLDIKEKAFEVPNKLSETVSGSTESDKSKHKPVSRSGDTIFPFKQTSQSIFHSSENLFKNSKEVLLKLASESSILQNGEEALIMEAANSNEECKMFFEQMKKLVESNDLENGRTRNKEKLESMQSTGINHDPFESSPSSSAVTTNVSCINDESLIAAAMESNAPQKPQQKGSNIDSKVLEFLKNANANAQKTASIPTKIGDTCTGHACGHKCKQEEELKKMTCVDSCDHHKDSRKCDCAYCEVFGSAFPPNAPKASETRDRLRTRLNQRKEKGKENLDDTVEKVTVANSRCTTKNSGNCTIKVSKHTKVPLSNGKTINVAAKTVPSEPPRVPELHHPVPPPGNSKTVHLALEVQKSTANDDKPSLINTSKGLSGTDTIHSAQDDSTSQRSPSSLSTCSLFSESVDCRDINELLNYIEGNKTVDKIAIAHKKAAKKARQRSKKAQEREQKERIELEKQRLKEEAKLREEKLREEEHRKAEASAKQLTEKQKSNKKDDKTPSRKELKKCNNRKSSNAEHLVKVSTTTNVGGKGSKLIEETIPAMVTIKRASEGSNSQATVTITLKGATPDTDKLLFTLVNGNENQSKENPSVPNKTKGKTNAPIKSPQLASTKVVTESVKPLKKKQEKEITPVTKPMKVTIAVDKNNTSKKETLPKKPIVKMDTFASHQLQQAFNNNKETDISHLKSQNKAKEEISLPMLNLPPGITITKIDGPPNTSSCKYFNSTTSHQNNHTQAQSNNIPPTKSGVIVVDTEKLIQQSIAASISKRDKKMNKKKRDQKTPTTKPQEVTKPPTMVTLKNPIFEAQQKKKFPEKSNFDIPSSQQASIFKGENGMVTIRSPRLQNPFETGAPVSSYFSDIQPMFSSDMTPPYVPMQQRSSFYDNSNNSQFSQYNSHYHAHEFLAGLPGIEITKINKAAAASEYENTKSTKPPDVSNIPTNNVVNGVNSFNFDADEWYYENVFKPKDNIEEEMDDEELELEEFKRFCHQSIPVTQKEKVNNLNMRDMVYNPKDVSYA